MSILYNLCLATYCLPTTLTIPSCSNKSASICLLHVSCSESFSEPGFYRLKITRSQNNQKKSGILKHAFASDLSILSVQSFYNSLSACKRV